MFFSPALATTTNDKSDPVECLALDMYHEARGQGSAGLLGVSSVAVSYTHLTLPTTVSV